MALMEWNDNLSVKIMEIDAQHKGLIKLVNDLYDAMGSGRGKEVIGKTLTELINYTKKHFSTEERYMRQYNYPGLALHKSEHDTLTRKVIDLNERFISGNAALTVEVMNFLRDWLIKHIMGTDKKYVAHFNTAGLK